MQVPERGSGQRRREHKNDSVVKENYSLSLGESQRDRELVLEVARSIGVDDVGYTEGCLLVYSPVHFFVQIMVEFNVYFL